MPDTIKLAQNFGADKLLDVADAANLTSQTTLPELIGNLIRTFIGLLGIVFLVLIVYAGYLWLTAQGDDDKVKHSKELLKNAVIGLIIISAAYAVAAFVINAVASTTNPVTGA